MDQIVKKNLDGTKFGPQISRNQASHCGIKK